jgi:hypothetical protein
MFRTGHHTSERQHWGYNRDIFVEVAFDASDSPTCASSICEEENGLPGHRNPEFGAIILRAFHQSLECGSRSLSRIGEFTLVIYRRFADNTAPIDRRGPVLSLGDDVPGPKVARRPAGVPSRISES